MHKLCAFWFHTLTASRSTLHQDNAVPLWGQSLVTCLRSRSFFVLFSIDEMEQYLLFKDNLPQYITVMADLGFLHWQHREHQLDHKVSPKRYNYATCHSLPISIFHSKQTLQACSDLHMTSHTLAKENYVLCSSDRGTQLVIKGGYSLCPSSSLGVDCAIMV